MNKGNLVLDIQEIIENHFGVSDFDHEHEIRQFPNNRSSNSTLIFTLSEGDPMNVVSGYDIKGIDKLVGYEVFKKGNVIYIPITADFKLNK